MRKRISDISLNLGAVIALCSYSIPWTFDKSGHLDEYYFMFSTFGFFLVFGGLTFYKENILTVLCTSFFGLFSVITFMDFIADSQVHTQLNFELTIICTLLVLVIYVVWKLRSFLKIL